MEEKNYRIVISELKELNGTAIFDDKITEETFLFIVDYLRKIEEKEKRKDIAP